MLQSVSLPARRQSSRASLLRAISSLVQPPGRSSCKETPKAAGCSPSHATSMSSSRSSSGSARRHNRATSRSSSRGRARHALSGTCLAKRVGEDLCPRQAVERVEALPLLLLHCCPFAVHPYALHSSCRGGRRCYRRWPSSKRRPPAIGSAQGPGTSHSARWRPRQNRAARWLWARGGRSHAPRGVVASRSPTMLL